MYTKKNSHVMKKYKHRPVLTKKKHSNILDKDVFSKIEIINELGAGMIGTTYLAKYNGKNYALKIQHILPEQRKKSFKSEVWREYDFYKYINTLPAAKQRFFTKLYHMEIYDNCTHVQRSNYIRKEGTFADRMRKLGESSWCVKYLMEYHGTQTLEKFIQTEKISNSNIISFALQIINILLILYSNGYSHNDLHLGNIMVKPTNIKTFKLQNITGHNIKIQTSTHSNNSLQLVAIDYGNVLHAKYHMDFTVGVQKSFIKDRQTYLFNEMFTAIANIIFYIKLIPSTQKIINVNKNCYAEQQKHKGYIWSSGMKNIIINHASFFSEKIAQYMAIFPAKDMPNADKLVLQLSAYMSNNTIYNKSLNDFIKNKPYAAQIRNIITRILYEFMYYYPEEFAKYFNRCAVIKIPYTESIVIGFLRCGNVSELVDLFVKLSLNK